MPILTRVALVLALTVLVVPQTGCLAVAAAAGAGATVAYVRGDSETRMEGSPGEVAFAAEQTFLEMGMAVISNRSTGIDSEVVARTARDRKVEVIAKAQGERSSMVAVRAGTFGDDDLQARVIDGIRMRLAAPPAEPVTGN